MYAGARDKADKELETVLATAVSSQLPELQEGSCVVVDTSRVRSQFDVELQLGRGWILTALRTLADNGLLFTPPPPVPPEAAVTVTDVVIVFESDDWDLRVDLTVAGLSISALARVRLADDGTELIITNNLTPDTTTLPFDVLQGLSSPPTLVKLRGDAGHESCLCLLANLDLQAGPQSEQPRDAGDPFPRGEPVLAQSFLPRDVHVAVGVGQATFPRLGNDVWHKKLRADDGSHPLPDADNPVGSWTVVSCAAQSNRIRMTLVGEVPIDLWPDATVTVDVYLTPRIAEGTIIFDINVDTDVDTGLLGDLFGGIVLGFVGLLLGVLTGGALLPLVGAGFIAGVVGVEVVELVVEGIVKRRILARLNGEAVPPRLSCGNSVVVEAVPTGDDHGIALAVLDAIPRSVTIASTEPDALYRRHIQVVTDFDDLSVDGNGFAFAGTSRTADAFEPIAATLFDEIRAAADAQLAALVYRATDGSSVQLDVPEALARAAEDDLTPPLQTEPATAGTTTYIRGRRLPVVCLTPTAIRRAETVVTDIRFSTALELSVPETVLLQDAGVLLLPGFQLIHPANAAPYFRAAPDSSTENNFENLPPF